MRILFGTVAARWVGSRREVPYRDCTLTPQVNAAPVVSLRQNQSRDLLGFIETFLQEDDDKHKIFLVIRDVLSFQNMPSRW